MRPLIEAKPDLVLGMMYPDRRTLEAPQRERLLVPGPMMDIQSPSQTWPAVSPLNKMRSRTSVIKEHPTDMDRTLVASRHRARDLHPDH